MLAIDFCLVAMLVVFSLFWAWQQFMESPPYVDPERYPVRGIDVSAHNGDIDFNAVRADGMEFVFIKASEGENFKDASFRRNFDKAKKAGMHIGAYHFFRFDRDGVNQAVNLLDAIGDRHPDLGIAVDVETAGNMEGYSIGYLKAQLQAMVDYLNLKGYRVMFYTNRDGYYDFIHEDFRGYPLWICAFTSTPIETDWTFWQFNHRGSVKGIKGNVDLNTFFGSREEWKEFITTSSASNDAQSIFA